MVWRVWRGVLGALLVSGAALWLTDAGAVEFCARKGGLIVIRSDTCRHKEQRIEAPLCACPGPTTSTTVPTPETRCCGGAVSAGCADVPADSSGVAMCQALATLAADGRFNYFAPPGSLCDGNGTCGTSRSVSPDCCQITTPTRLCYQGFNPSGPGCTALGGTVHLGSACLPSGDCAAP